MVLKSGEIVMLSVQKDIPYLRSGNRDSIPFVPSCPIVIPRPTAKVMYAPSVDGEAGSDPVGPMPKCGDTAIGGGTDAGQGGEGGDDGRDAVCGSALGRSCSRGKVLGTYDDTSLQKPALPIVHSLQNQTTTMPPCCEQGFPG